MSFGSKKEPRYATLFSQRVPVTESPPGSPLGPLWREITAYRAFLPLTSYISLFIFPSESLAKESTPCSLTGSPWAVINCHQGHWSTFHSFIHVHLPESPKGALLHTYGEKYQVTIHRAPCRLKAYIQWGAAWFPKEIVTTLLSLPQCHAAFSTMPSTLSWVDQSPISQYVSWQPPSGYTLHNCYRLPRDPGWSRVQKIPRTADGTSTR